MLAITAIYPRGTDQLIDLDEADFYAGRLDFQQLITVQNIPRDPQLLKPIRVPGARSIRLMLEFTF